MQRIFFLTFSLALLDSYATVIYFLKDSNGHFDLTMEFILNISQGHTKLNAWGWRGITSFKMLSNERYSHMFLLW